MSANAVYDVWDRWLAINSLQADFLARYADHVRASLDGGQERMNRVMRFFPMPGWPLLTGGIGVVQRSLREWTELVEDESRNMAQDWMLTESEMIDWGNRFARTLEGK